VVPSIIEIVHGCCNRRAMLDRALLASIVPVAKKWAKKRRVAAARMAKLKQHAAEVVETEELSRGALALVVLQYALGVVGAFLPEAVEHPVFAPPPSLFDATRDEKKAPIGALISALVSARVGGVYGVKNSPPKRHRVKPRSLCQVFVRCGGKTRTFCYTSPRENIGRVCWHVRQLQRQDPDPL
jgi:hypothetical protein